MPLGILLINEEYGLTAMSPIHIVLAVSGHLGLKCDSGCVGQRPLCRGQMNIKNVKKSKRTTVKAEYRLAEVTVNIVSTLNCYSAFRQSISTNLFSKVGKRSPWRQS